MGVRNLDDLQAWQLSQAFKREVYRLIQDGRLDRRDFRYVEQLRAAASSVGMNIGEGFYRYGAKEFSRFLSIALGSLAESMLWLRDGIDRGHFTSAQCEDALSLGRRCRGATLRLIKSLDRFK